MTNREMMTGLREKKDPLDLSIQKWVDIVEEKGQNDGQRNCALCELYLNKRISCKGCPINPAGENESCHDTPYNKFVEHVFRCEFCYDRVGGYCPTAMALAKEELDFLQAIKASKNVAEVIKEGGEEE